MNFGWEGKELRLKLERYQNGRIAVAIMNGLSKYGTLSTNIAELDIEYEEFFVPLWNHDNSFIAKVLETRAFIDTGRISVGTSWNQQVSGPKAAVWRIVDPEMLVQLEIWIDEDMKAVDAATSRT